MTEHAKEEGYAGRALELMREYDVPPTPSNYTLWYHYAQGQNEKLIYEMDGVIESKSDFSEITTEYLCSKYIEPNPQKRQAIDASAAEAQTVLSDVMKTVDDITHETHSYNQDVDHYLDTITQDLDQASVKDVLKHLVEATVELKESGGRMQKNLEESKKEVEDLKHNLHQATAESERDFLTGLYNRKTFEHLADEQMQQAKEDNTELCLLMLDIDHFKQFNDNFGHLLGDEVLKIVSHTLTSRLKGRDVIGRFGGEEFVITLPETPLNGAMKVADILRHSIADKHLKKKNTGERFGQMTVSIGVARYDVNTDTLSTLINRADEALYDSKNGGRNQVSTREK